MATAICETDRLYDLDNGRFSSLAADECAEFTYDPKRCYSKRRFLRDMNDAKRRALYENCKLQWADEGTTIRRLYEKNEWASFVPQVMLEPILQHTTYASIAEQLANTTTIPQGIDFLYREFEHYGRAQRMGENTEPERKKGLKRTQRVDLHTLGVRSYVTEEEILDIPIDAMQLELATMGASIALERDLLWVNSLYKATSGTNATTFHNHIDVLGGFTVDTLHLVLTWFVSPFNTSGQIQWTGELAETERLMRLGKYKPTDVLVSAKTYWDIVSNKDLQKQYIWNNSRILDTGALEVPLMGVNIHKTNMGYFADENDPASWTPTDDIIICDKPQGGTGTIGVRQPLQVRQWDMQSFRTHDFMIFMREGYAVQNRRALLRISPEVDPYTDY